MISKFDGLNVWETIGYIFFNNLRASFFAIVLGIMLAIPTIFFIITNGYLLGFVSRYAASGESLFVLWKLLPHGIFEIPAVMVSLGVGIKIGTDVLRKDRAKLLPEDFNSALKLFLLVIIPLLLVAAIIEGVLVFYIG